MQIRIVGTGYVGLVSGVCFAELGHQVVCIDKNEEKISRLRAGEVPIYEPGLADKVGHLSHLGRIRFSDEYNSVADAEIVVLAVGTPPNPDGSSNLTDLRSATEAVAAHLSGYTIIMTKSTVPVGTNEQIKSWISARTNEAFDVVAVPEFMREGSALHDAMHPDRVVIGAEHPGVAERIAQLHRPLTDQILITELRTAELIKYASNAFLATKISFINEMANLCDKVGADIAWVAKGMGMDPRIGSSFLQAGIGYGGSCFPKDTQALLQIAGQVDYEFKLLKAVVEVNRFQKVRVIEILTEYFNSLQGKVIAVWGASFKPNTDDIRSAPSLDVVASLVEAGARIQICDPVAQENFRRAYDHPEIQWFEHPADAGSGADAVCLLTEWPIFAEVNFDRLRERMSGTLIVDGRNFLPHQQIRNAGLTYCGIGRPGLSGR